MIGAGPFTDLPTAATILGLSRSTAYELAKAGRFPVPLIRAGSSYRVPVAALLDVLHLQPQIGGGLDCANAQPLASS